LWPSYGGLYPFGFYGAGFYGGIVSGFSTPYSSYAPPYPPTYPVYSYQPAPAPAPVVIINQLPPIDEPRYVERRPAPRYEEQEESTLPARPEPYRPITYEIVFRNGKTVTALAYWVKDGRLHYVTTDHAMLDVPAASVDRNRSAEANEKRGVTFRMPAIR
jgi:hypothetical protein